MTRRLFTIAALLSLAMGLLIAAMWVMSYRHPQVLRVWGLDGRSEIGLVFIRGTGRLLRPTTTDARGRMITRQSQIGRTIPLLVPVCLSLVLPGLWLLSIRGRKETSRRRLAKLCPICGYDLRVTRDRCPECGTAIPAEAKP
jgi:hypothetical protein